MFFRQGLTELLQTCDLSTVFAVAIVLYICIIYLNRTFLHPLAKIPGPLVARYTSLWQIYHSYMGDECTVVQKLHDRYGKVVRIGPNLIDIADGAALGPIYADKGGFQKPSVYHNAYVDGLATVFSTTDPAYRATRAKAVASLFSNAAIRKDKDLIYQSIERFTHRLHCEKEKANGAPINLQEHARALGLDVLSSYLFRHWTPDTEKRIWDGLMIPWLNIIVDVGQFFYLPSWLFRFCVGQHLTFRPERDRESQAVRMVHEYTKNLVEENQKLELTFQGKLLEHGLSREQAAAECKSMMVAGTHSFGTVLAQILWLLIKNSTAYDYLRAEILANRGEEFDVQQLPYLQGVIKEGFRLAPANTTRLPRVVPDGGWQFGEHFFPAGTTVGIAAPQLFFNPDTFPHPAAFRPERWRNPSAEMQRDLVPFSLGSRQCIAKNLATAELFMVVEKVVESDVLRGAKTVQDEVKVWEWFNVAFKNNKLEVVWLQGKDR